MSRAARHRVVARALPLLTLLLCAEGCTSFSTMARARTIEPGRTEVWGAPEAFAVMSESGASVRPVVEAGVRYGAARDVDVGARITTLGAAIGPRVQLHRSRDPRSGVDLVLAPSVSYTYVDKLGLDVGCSLGINLGEHQLVLTARLAYQMRVGVGGQDAPLSFFHAGGSVGLALRVDPHLTLMPEVALLTQVAAEPGYASNFADAVGMQAGVGFLFDL